MFSVKVKGKKKKKEQHLFDVSHITQLASKL